MIDLRAGRRLRTLAGLKEPQGIAFVPETNRLFVANGRDGTCAIFHGDTFDLLHTAKFSSDADNVRYDAAARRIYVGYGEGALGILDAVNGRHLGDIRLGGHPESFRLETSGPRIFVNVPTTGRVAVVNRATGAAVAFWSLAGARSNFPMALDEANHRLFVGCRNPAKVLVYNTQTGQVVATLDIGGDTDDLFYDAVRKRLYVSCGAGFLDVFAQRSANQYESLAIIRTAIGARTSLFVPELGRLYLAVPHRGRLQQAEIRVYAAQP